MPLTIMRICCAAGALALATLTGQAAAAEDLPVSQSLAGIQASGRLVVLTRNAPTTWYIGRDGEPTGPEHDLVEAFARWLGVKVEFHHLDSVGAILSAIQGGHGDLAAAGLTITRERARTFRFGPPYQAVTQQVVCRRDNVQPETLTELADVPRIAVIADSSYAELLHALRRQGYPTPDWTEVADTSTEELLRQVWRRRIDCTVADSTIVDINRRYFPELLTPMNLSREQQLGWVMPKSSRGLDGAVTKWLKKYRASGRLADVQERYYGFFQRFDYVDTRVFIRRTDDRFPRYSAWFRDAAEQYGLPFVLLAAQAYQESHWNAHATSPTGVRGIMMLTRTTARAVGVKNRLDPRQSIFGGAKYMARMKGRLSEKVREPDRTWLALAAYNIGRAHLHDAQVLARRQGLDPYRWHDIKQVLPLLSKRRYYRTLTYGYARGWEPVRYVRHVREYRHVLAHELRKRGHGI